MTLNIIPLGSQPEFVLLDRNLKKNSKNTEAYIEMLTGSSTKYDMLNEIKWPQKAYDKELFIVEPYRQIMERGFDYRDDKKKLIVLEVDQHQYIARDKFLKGLSKSCPVVIDGKFDIDDEEYANIVKKIQSEVIAEGKGANFVIKRSFEGKISEINEEVALALFSSLLSKEVGAYWTYLVYLKDLILVGASPEQHISLSDQLVTMNPISGTFRYSEGNKLDRLMAFLNDPKETDELYMVLDEELKMMSEICHSDIKVAGPYLRFMNRVAHTEYLIHGSTTDSTEKILTKSLLAPTVTGSPLGSACTVIKDQEYRGRSYYSGVVALTGYDRTRGPWLDSAINIRVAEIDTEGHVRIDVGATIVRHSKPIDEAKETQSKIEGLLSALNSLSEHLGSNIQDTIDKDVQETLERRNSNISKFWQNGSIVSKQKFLIKRNSLKVLLVDAEDSFNFMLAHQLNSLGADTEILSYAENLCFKKYDLVVMGPGPGDPTDSSSTKMKMLEYYISTLLADNKPLIAVCLSHQILSHISGLEIKKLKKCNQGVQSLIEWWSGFEKVGFYNSYSAYMDIEKKDGTVSNQIKVCYNTKSGEVYSLKGDKFASVQFHPESILTINGPKILSHLITHALD